MVHVGVDLDKRSSQIAVLTEDGEVRQQRLPNEATRLEKFFAELPPHTPVAIEASGTWWWLVDLLEHLLGGVFSVTGLPLRLQHPVRRNGTVSLRPQPEVRPKELLPVLSKGIDAQ